jgi:ribosomal protein L32E
MAKKEKQIKKVEKQLAEAKIVKVEKPAHVKGTSPSGLAVANFLIKELGEAKAKKIAAGMTAAAKTKSMKKRLGRIEVCVESASESASESAAA